jgi:phage terminase Nu1 subunit (DNA packaging protein)
MATENAGLITTAVACQLLMLTRQRLDQLAAEGWIARHSAGRWRTVDLVQGYIRFMRDEGRRQNVKAADSRVRDARARDIEIRNAERLGRLVSVEELDAIIDEVCGAFRSELSGLPARVTRDLQMRRVIETEVHGVLARIAAIADANATRLEASRVADPAIGANNAGPLGGAQSDVPAVGTDTGTA